MNKHDILYGKDNAKGIVSVYANRNGLVTIWQRENDVVNAEKTDFWNWFILTDETLLNGIPDPKYQLKELSGNHPLRWAVCTKEYQFLERAVVKNYNAQHNTSHRSFYDLPNGVVIHFPATEQYLIQAGRTYFKGMEWNDLHRLQFDLETYSLDPKDGGIFLITITDNRGYERIIDDSQMSEVDMICELVSVINDRNPDIIENHNIFEFDLPFLEHRAKMHKTRLTLGRDGSTIWTQSGTLKVAESSESFTRYVIKGREIIDTLHAVKRWNGIMRELKSEGLKETAQYFGIASPDREYIDGDKVPDVWKSDPDRVRRYALDDVGEVAAISDMLMTDKFILSQLVPMQFGKVATAGQASCLDSLMVRAYLSQKHSLPQSKPKAKFKGGETQLIAEGVISNVLHADVSSMYPSIMLNYNVKPESDNLDIFLTIVRELTNIRLDAKGKLKTLKRGSATALSSEKGTSEYNNTNALQSAMKILINSAFGYMGAEFTVFNEPKQAGEVTRYGREILTEMLTVIRELNGHPIEADTDGIYLALPDDADASEFIREINRKVNREGIKIDGEEYTSMFSIAKKQYGLLGADGKIIVKGGGLKSRATEPFLTEFLSTGLGCLLRYDIDGLRNTWNAAVDEIRSGDIDVVEISKMTYLKRSVADYQRKHKVRQTHYEAAITAGRTDLKAGARVEYYKTMKGWMLSSDYNGDHDDRHYLNRLKQTAEKFRKAFTPTDFRTLFATERDLFTNATSVIKPIFRIVDDEEREWIELAHGIKLNMSDPNCKIDRRWVEADDVATINEFREKYNDVDVYRTQLAVMAEQEPTGDLSQHPRYGDFWLEFEGDKINQEIMMQALKAAHESYDIVENLFGCSASIRYRYNGGKSLYLYIQMSIFEKSPTYNLHQKYEKVAQRITQELPKELQHIPDLTLYEMTDRVLRLEGSIYPDGGHDVSVPTDLILSENWDAIVALSENDDPTDGGEDNITKDAHEEPQQETLILYQEITKDVPDAPPKKGNSGKRSLKRRQASKEWQEHFGNLGIPCAKALAEAVRVGESIGFEGRNKLIFELHYSGLEENKICELFLANGDSTRYGVLEEDTRPNANACGYRLRSRFNPFDGEFDFDPSCKHFPHLCDATKCYRAEEFRNNEQFEQLSFDEFREKARNELESVMNDEASFTMDDETETQKINVVDASLSSGKTYQIARKGKELTNDGYTTIALAPTHDACSKMFYELSEKHGGVSENLIAVHVFGQREETCVAEMLKKGQGCSSCKYAKKFYDEKEGHERRKKIQRECCGNVHDLNELKDLAEKYDTCASTISKVLAKSEIEGIAVFAVMPHAYLINRQNRRLIEGINPDYVFVDEADMLIETMLSQYQRNLQVAGSRSRIDRIYSMPCGHACDRCYAHFSDAFTNRIRPHAKLETPSAYDEVGKPGHFLEYIRESVNEVEKMVASSTVIDVFDFEAIRRNIDRIGQALSVVPYEKQSPYEYFTAIRDGLIKSPPEGVLVDCLYEGLFYEVFDKDTGQRTEKEIRPPVYVTKIEVERALTDEGLEMLAFPEWAGDPDVTPAEAEILGDDLPEQGNILPSQVYTNKETAHALNDTELNNSLRTFLEFANFVEGAPQHENVGMVGMYFETPLRNEEAIDEEIGEAEQEDGSFHAHVAKRAGISYCAIRLRYLDVDGYRSAVKSLQRRKTMMLSGTFLDRDRLAENLLLQPDEVNYIDARVPMHDSALIIHHNPDMGKLIRGMTGISVSAFGDWQALQLYNEIAGMRYPTNFLHYAVNTRQGNMIYSAVENSQHLNDRFYVQNECNEKTQIPKWCSAEKTLMRKSDWLFFDKIRSSTSRAVDREQFHVLTVHRNGYPDWYDMLPLISAIREYVSPDVDLEAVIEYNRQRAVFQTLLRNQRNEQRHVSIYLSGDMHYTAYPDYLRNRVVETNALMRKLKEMYPDDFLSNRQVQMEMIAKVAVAFLKEKLNDIDAFLNTDLPDPNNPPEILEAVFGDFEFKGNYGKGESARKVEVDLSDLPDDDKYLIESFVDEHSKGTDHARAYQTAIERLEHMKKCVAEKGYVDKDKDKKGERPTWKKWIDHLVQKEFLRPTKIKTKTRSKKVYEMVQNHATTE